ncbi:MAG: transposase, partial [Thaumarchaeota archaeon]|nr:transposase [Nitrososphaerota archaeon]
AAVAIASRLSQKRDSIGAIGAFNRAIRVAVSSEPERVSTGAAPAYDDGIRRSFGDKFDRRPKHIARMGVCKRTRTTNRIERLNMTLREQVKVQHGWKSMKTQLAEGQRIQHNFAGPI